MRATILALMLAAGLAAAGAAAAQDASHPVSTMTPPTPTGTGEFDHYQQPGDTLADRYDFKVMMLQRKMDRLTREDGGKLSAEHQAGLQAELDKLNHAYGIRTARR